MLAAMAMFQDDREVYEYIGSLLADLLEDAELVDEFRRANTIVQYVLRDPDAIITMKVLAGEDTAIDFGPTALEPELVMTMEADTAHRFWLGKVNITVALARGQMKARGPVAKILKLVPLAKPLFPRYRERLEAAGREDLLEAVLTPAS
jgi:putative sterol carrier protein